MTICAAKAAKAFYLDPSYVALTRSLMFYSVVLMEMPTERCHGLTIDSEMYV